MRDIVSPLSGIRSPFGQRSVAIFSPLSLFASGEEGAWYEPSTTTCFTDTGGTTPATYGDGVAYLQDLSGNGNHATQVTAGARPILARAPEGGRRNELSETDTLATQSVTVTAAERTLSFKGTGTVTLSGASTAGPLVGTGAEDRVSLTFTPSAGSLTLTVSGTVTDAQLELGASATTYQSVADSLGYDITEAGVTSLEYLAFDGADDFLVTPTALSHTSTNDYFLSAAVTTPASPQTFFSYGGYISGGFVFQRFNSTSIRFARGASVFFDALNSITDEQVLTATNNASGASIRIDGSDTSTNANIIPITGKTITLGRREDSGGSQYHSGKLYGVVFRISVSTTDEISDTETYLAAKTGVTL